MLLDSTTLVASSLSCLHYSLSGCALCPTMRALIALMPEDVVQFVLLPEVVYETGGSAPADGRQDSTVWPERNIRQRQVFTLLHTLLDQFFSVNEQRLRSSH